LKVLETGGDTVGSTRTLAELTSKLLEDTKGALSKITDPNIKLQLATGSRNVAREVGLILNNSLSIATQVSGKADPRQMEYLRNEQTRFLQQLSSINSSISSSQNVLRRDPQATNFEILAEQELNNALRTLADILTGLKSQNAARPGVPTGTLDMGATIGKASEAIVMAIGHLVSVSHAAQQERVKREASGVGEQFHKDPMWTEALVNASKGVVDGARKLGSACGNCTATHIDAVSLKAASRAIAASTAQLVAASRAKNHGQAQVHINQAAEVVTGAIHDLVEAFSNVEDTGILANSDSFADFVKDEIAYQSDIIRTEKELERAKNKLAQMNQARANIQPTVVSSTLPSGGEIPPKSYSIFGDNSDNIFGPSSLPPPTGGSGSSSNYNPFS